MNAARPPVEAPPAEDAAEIARLTALFAAQRTAFAACPFPSLGERRRRLRALRQALRLDQDAIAAAISADFGGRSAFESKFSDVLGPILAIDHARRHLRRWMRPSRRRAELLFATNRVEVRYQPKGIVGIIAPWNFPVYLALGPLVTAIAAGNRALIKMSEYTPRTTAVVRSLIARAFSEDEVAVVGGGVPVAKAFSALAFDHLVFTGSTAVAPEVVHAAAANLTPLTLELGGKSPALLGPRADLAASARRIVHGKSVNAGQTCVAPDYALVPRDRVAEFSAAAVHAYQQLAAAQGERERTAIASERQQARLLELIADARAKGATVTAAGEPGAGRRLPLFVVTGVRDDMRIAREELFGPILPVIAYDTLEQAIGYILSRPRPLALYPFGLSGGTLEALLRATHSGGVTVDDWGWHVFNHDLPFGGTGQSGMGGYHGAEGFRELSHQKAVFRRRRLFPMELFYPPYGRFVQRLALRYYLGRARTKR